MINRLYIWQNSFITGQKSFSNILVSYVTFQTTPSPGRVKDLVRVCLIGQLLLSVTVNQNCPPKSIKRDTPFPTAEKAAEERAEERAEKREPTKRSLREQANRENEASHQEENLESEELPATAERS